MMPQSNALARATENDVLTLPMNDVVAVALVEAIRGGDISALRRLLDEHPELATARLESAKGTTRTALHVAADWPGYFPNGPAVVNLLICAGADPNAHTPAARTRRTPCLGLPAATTLRWPLRSSLAAPISKRPAPRLPAVLHWT